MYHANDSGGSGSFSWAKCEFLGSLCGQETAAQHSDMVAEHVIPLVQLVAEQVIGSCSFVGREVICRLDGGSCSFEALVEHREQVCSHFGLDRCQDEQVYRRRQHVILLYVPSTGIVFSPSCSLGPRPVSWSPLALLRHAVCCTQHISTRRFDETFR